MIITATTLSTHQEADTVSKVLIPFVEENIEGFTTRVNSTLDRLAVILDKFIHEEDELSLRLFEWGTRAIAFMDFDRIDEEKFKQIVATHFMSLENELCVPLIQMQAIRSNLPVEIKIHKFAQEMIIWHTETQEIIQSSSKDLAIRETKTINLASLPTPVALLMYNMQLEKARSIEEQRDLQCMIDNQTEQLSDLTKSVKKRLKKGKEEITENIRMRELHISQRMTTMEKGHKFQTDMLKSDIDRVKSTLLETKVHLHRSQKISSDQGKEIRLLIQEQRRLRSHVADLEWEVDSGFCVLI